MALDASDPFHNDWYSAMFPAPMPADPLAIAAPVAPPMAEFASPELPPPPVPAGAPIDPYSEPAPTTPPALVPEPEIEMPPEYVGRSVPLDPAVQQAAAGPAVDPAFAPLSPDTWALPTPEPTFDATSPASWSHPLAPDAADAIAGDEPIGHRRIGAADHEQSLSEAELRALNPMERAEYEFAEELKRERFANEKLAAIRASDAAKAEEAERTYLETQQRAREVTEAALADAESLANEKPAKFGDSLGRVLQGVGAIFLGQFGAAATGGRNAAVDVVSKRMDNFAQEQIADYNRKAGNVDRKLNIAARLRDAGYNDYQTTTIIRQAGLQRAHAQLMTDIQNFDPRGTTARRMDAHRRQLEAQMVQNAHALGRQNLDDQLKVLEVKGKALDVLAKEKKLRGIGAGGQKRPPEYFAALGLKKPPFPVTDKEYDAWQKREEAQKKLAGGNAEDRKKEADASKAEAEAEAAKLGYVLKNPETGKPFLNPDGKPVVEMDATKRNRAAAIVEAAANIRRLADRMTALKEKGGGHWKALGSDEAQEIQSLVSAIDFETFKAFDLGAPSEGDKALAEGVRGGVDPSSFVKNAAKGFQTYATAVEQKANTAIRGSGYTGPPLKFTRQADLPKAKPTELEEDVQLIIKSEYTPKADPVSTLMGTPEVDTLSEDAPENVDALLGKIIGKARHGDGDAWKALEKIEANAVSPALKSKAAGVLVERPR